MESKKLLLALSIKYKGEWDKIYTAIEKREDLDEKNVEELAQEYEGRYITMLDNEYPEILRQSYKPPFVLFYEGNIDLLNSDSKKIALNDKRHTTEFDNQVVEKLFQDLPQNIVFIIGGTGQLTKTFVDYSKPVIVVLPYSIDKLEDNGLKRRILNNGGVIISEYPNNTEMSEDNCIVRYRIMNALCDKVLIPTSFKQQSGTTILINMALQQNKDIIVVPTSPLESEDYANNKLIGEGAYPVYDSESLNYIMA